MLRNVTDLEDYGIGATDGPIGHVKDFYFDDEVRVICYLVVETGHWLASRKVLISPIAIGKPDWFRTTGAAAAPATGPMPKCARRTSCASDDSREDAATSLPTGQYLYGIQSAHGQVS